MHSVCFPEAKQASYPKRGLLAVISSTALGHVGYQTKQNGIWIEAACKQTEAPQHLAGVLQAEAKLIGSDDDFATLPNATASQLAAAAALASGPAAAAAASSSGMVWDKPQASALHSFVVSLLDLQGGRDDNQTMWEDVAAKSELWGSYEPTAAELRHVYDQVTFVPP